MYARREGLKGLISLVMSAPEIEVLRFTYARIRAPARRWNREFESLRSLQSRAHRCDLGFCGGTEGGRDRRSTVPPVSTGCLLGGSGARALPPSPGRLFFPPPWGGARGRGAGRQDDARRPRGRPLSVRMGLRSVRTPGVLTRAGEHAALLDEQIRDQRSPRVRGEDPVVGQPLPARSGPSPRGRGAAPERVECLSLASVPTGDVCPVATVPEGCPAVPGDRCAASDAGRRTAEGRPLTGWRGVRQGGEVPYLSSRPRLETRAPLRRSPGACPPGGC